MRPTISSRTVQLTLAPLVLLLVPAVGMSVSGEWNWTIFDFVAMGVLLVFCGLAYALMSRWGGLAYRAGLALAVVASLLLVWVNLAVGIIGGEENPANLLYLVAPLVGLAGAVICRLSPEGMACAAFLAAAATLVAPVAAAALWRPVFDSGFVQVLTLSAAFAMLYLGSGVLFRRAAEASEENLDGANRFKP